MLSCIMAARALHDGCTSIQHIYSPITMLTKLIGCYYNFIIKRLVLKDEGKVEVFFFISSSFTISKLFMIYFLCRLVVEVVKKHPKFIPHTIDFVNSVEKWTPDRWVCTFKSCFTNVSTHNSNSRHI